MRVLNYSASAEKKIATYLDYMADMKLGGADNSYTHRRLSNAAVAALHQIMLDNDETTGYSATLAEIKMEQSA